MAQLYSDKLAVTAFNAHMTSGDHDGRYYTAATMNELLAAKLNTDAHVKSIYINATHTGVTFNLDNVEAVVPRMTSGSCIRYMQFNGDLSKLNLSIYHEGHIYNKWIQLSD